jgi:hypothetical protein
MTTYNRKNSQKNIDEQCVYKASIHLFPMLFSGLSVDQLSNDFSVAAWVQLKPIKQATLTWALHLHM